MLTAARRQKGFTLLEIMIAIVIMVIITAAAMYAFSHFGQGQRLLKQYEQIQEVLSFARQDALVNGNISGVEISAHGYQLVQWQGGVFHNWQPLTHSSSQESKVNFIFSSHKALPEATPQVIAFTPTGDLFTASKYAPYYIVLQLTADTARQKALKIAQNGVVSQVDPNSIKQEQGDAQS